MFTRARALRRSLALAAVGAAAVACGTQGKQTLYGVCLRDSDCRSPFKCIDSECALVQARLCDPAATRCNGDAVERCASTGEQWEMDPPCPSGCDSATGACRRQACTPFERRCADTEIGYVTSYLRDVTVLVCMSNGQGFMAAQTCPTKCIGDTDARCAVPECNPHETRCKIDGSPTLETCDARATGWSEQPCPAVAGATALCVGGRCRVKVCDSGQERCRGSLPEKCRADQTGYEANGAPCPAGCSMTATSPKHAVCTAPTCVPWETRCKDGDNTKLLMCNSRGTAWIEAPCGTTAVPGVCVDPPLYVGNGLSYATEDSAHPQPHQAQCVASACSVQRDSSGGITSRAQRCQGNWRQRCNDSQDGWENIPEATGQAAPCPFGCRMNAAGSAVCAQAACAAGATQCSEDGDALLQCQPDRSAFAFVRYCATGCVPSGASADCAPVGCDAGTGNPLASPLQRRCNGDTIEMCDADGASWAALETCSLGCANARCNVGADACTPGELRCRGLDSEVCVETEDGATGWQFRDRCLGACSNGVCTSAEGACGCFDGTAGACDGSPGAEAGSVPPFQVHVDLAARGAGEVNPAACDTTALNPSASCLCNPSAPSWPLLPACADGNNPATCDTTAADPGPTCVCNPPDGAWGLPPCSGYPLNSATCNSTLANPGTSCTCVPAGTDWVTLQDCHPGNNPATCNTTLAAPGPTCVCNPSGGSWDLPDCEKVPLTCDGISRLLVYTDPIADSTGRLVPDGTLVTFSLDGGDAEKDADPLRPRTSLASLDADADTPGLQRPTLRGRARVLVVAPPSPSGSACIAHPVSVYASLGGACTSRVQFVVAPAPPFGHPAYMAEDFSTTTLRDGAATTADWDAARGIASAKPVFDGGSCADGDLSVPAVYTPERCGTPNNPACVPPVDLWAAGYARAWNVTRIGSSWVEVDSYLPNLQAGDEILLYSVGPIAGGTDPTSTGLSEFKRVASLDSFRIAFTEPLREAYADPAVIRMVAQRVPNFRDVTVNGRDPALAASSYGVLTTRGYQPSLSDANPASCNTTLAAPGPTCVCNPPGGTWTLPPCPGPLVNPKTCDTTAPVPGPTCTCMPQGPSWQRFLPTCTDAVNPSSCDAGAAEPDPSCICRPEEASSSWELPDCTGPNPASCDTTADEPGADCVCNPPGGAWDLPDCAGEPLNPASCDTTAATPGPSCTCAPRDAWDLAPCEGNLVNPPNCDASEAVPNQWCVCRPLWSALPACSAGTAGTGILALRVCRNLSVTGLVSAENLGLPAGMAQTATSTQTMNRMLLGSGGDQGPGGGIVFVAATSTATNPVVNPYSCNPPGSAGSCLCNPPGGSVALPACTGVLRNPITCNTTATSPGSTCVCSPGRTEAAWTALPWCGGVAISAGSATAAGGSVWSMSGTLATGSWNVAAAGAVAGRVRLDYGSVRTLPASAVPAPPAQSYFEEGRRWVYSLAGLSEPPPSCNTNDPVPGPTCNCNPGRTGSSWGTLPTCMSFKSGRLLVALGGAGLTRTGLPSVLDPTAGHPGFSFDFSGDDGTTWGSVDEGSVTFEVRNPPSCDTTKPTQGSSCVCTPPGRSWTLPPCPPLIGQKFRFRAQLTPMTAMRQELLGLQAFLLLQ